MHARGQAPHRRARGPSLPRAGRVNQSCLRSKRSTNAIGGYRECYPGGTGIESGISSYGGIGHDVEGGTSVVRVVSG